MLRIALYTDGNHPKQPVAYWFFDRNKCAYSGLRLELPSLQYFNDVISGIALNERISPFGIRRFKFYDLQTQRGYPLLRSGTFQYDFIGLKVDHKAKVLQLLEMQDEECPEGVYQAFRSFIGKLEPFSATEQELKDEEVAENQFRQWGLKLLTPGEARRQGFVFIGGFHSRNLFGLMQGAISGHRLKEIYSERDIKRLEFALVDNRNSPWLMGQAAGFSPGAVDRCQFSLWPSRRLAEKAR